MINVKFEKWAKGYSGFDGGNPKGKIWLCGIEWGGKSPENLEDLKELFKEDVSQIPTGYKCYTENMKYPQYNVKFIKVMASLNDIEFIKNHKYDRKTIEAFNEKEKFFTKTSNYLKLNLLPLNFPSVDESKWSDNLYEEATGFGTKREYMEWSLKVRLEMFQEMTKKYSPKLIMTVGKTHLKNFKNAFGYSDIVFNDEKFECNSSKEYKYFYDEKNHRLIINFPFFSGKYGLNSNCLLIEAGKVIQNLIEEHKISL